MSSQEYIIGIDTSNYTTSLSIMTPQGKLIANLKKLLDVKLGERGLRQSDAIFMHTKNIPLLFREAKAICRQISPVAIGVSEKPRNTEGSYMPCFLSGMAAAEAISAVTGAPVYKFSHQCGHIMAAVYSSGRFDLLDRDFAAFHISGGTTELVKVSRHRQGFKTEIVGGTADLNAGQVIDRVGVFMQLPFPAGVCMEKLALENKKKIPSKKICENDIKVNLSGLENMAYKLYNETQDKPLVAHFVLDFIGRNIISMSSAYEKKFGKTDFVYAGGVMCNSIIRNMLREKFSAIFADVSVSSDNAVGIAELARRAFLEK